MTIEVKHFVKIMAFFVIGLLVAGQLFAQSGDRETVSEKKPDYKPVPVVNGMAKLGPENSKIEFVGIHVGEKPDPRLGGFKKFQGSINLAADQSVESIQLDIDVKSIWTEFAELTAHLHNADFFESGKFGVAKFVSTNIAPTATKLNVTGNLTLHGVTKEISFPAKGQLNENGILMLAEFKIDRTMFGMDKMTSGVDKMVSLKFVVGQKTTPSKEMPGPGTKKDSAGSEAKGSDKKETESKGPGSRETPELTSVSLFAPNML